MYPAGVPDVTTRYVTTASGLRIRVIESGPESGKPLLLLHGWGRSAYAWRYMIEPLSRRGYHAMAVDLKGHGLSDKPSCRNEYTLASMTEHALDVLKAL